VLEGRCFKLNFNHLLKESSQKYSNNIFLQYEEDSYTYDMMWELTSRLATGFLNTGIKKGDHVAIVLSNRPEFIWSWFALAKIGAIAVTIDTRLTGPLLRYQLKNSKSKALITESQFVSTLEALQNIQELDLEHSIVISESEDDTYLTDWEATYSNFQDLMKEVPLHDQNIAYHLTPGWPFSIVYTSGTTGPSKGVVNPHETFVLSGRDIGKAVGMSQTDKLFLFLPLFHANPQLMGIPAMILNGATLVLGKKFSASTFWETVSRYQITIFTYVGTVLSILDKVTTDNTVTTLRAAYGGGAPEKVWRNLESKVNFKIIEGYGMAEIGGFATMNALNDHKFGSIGKARELYEINIFDQHDQKVPIGEIGEIVVRPKIPYSMFSSYFNMEEVTLSSMRNLWFHTGDLAKIDKDGYFYFVGRKKNMIRKKGENISAYEIENIIQQHPNVIENAVVPVPDEIAGEEIKVCIVSKQGQELSITELEQWFIEHLPAHMIPRYVDIRHSFEKTSSEKIKIQVLIEEGLSNVWDREKQKLMS
jgi:crotonobetaine/carnitine-CoA ligase